MYFTDTVSKFNLLDITILPCLFLKFLRFKFCKYNNNYKATAMTPDTDTSAKHQLPIHNKNIQITMKDKIQSMT